MGSRDPYYISGADGGVLSIAGMRDRWTNPDTSETTMSCTIIVTGANTLTRPIHDRMPVSTLEKVPFSAECHQRP
ncbi:MAG TPA: SOS response-associated peptidase family protein [Xanthobacteraceae bacterium]|nr:SOS response-associated peptidase family protein [Xanthobacteraceae bacterium]